MERATPFTDAEMDAWRPNLQAWLLIMRDLDHQLQRDADMPHAYFAILFSLLDAKEAGGVPLTVLADAMDYSQSRMSHAIRKLELRGWVERRTGTDRRIRSVRITSAGRRAYLGALSGHFDQVRASFFANLTDRDLDDLRRIGPKLVAGLSQVHRDIDPE